MNPAPGHDRPPATWPFWVAGTAVAFFGVFLVRVVAPGLTAARTPVVVAGFVLALLGLFVITVGTRRKYTYLARRDRPDQPE
jgi:drug/metabolite transporter (DMT)-like permease